MGILPTISGVVTMNIISTFLAVLVNAFGAINDVVNGTRHLTKSFEKGCGLVEMNVEGLVADEQLILDAKRAATAAALAKLQGPVTRDKLTTSVAQELQL